jgi:hypothetical protein
LGLRELTAETTKGRKAKWTGQRELGGRERERERERAGESETETGGEREGQGGRGGGEEGKRGREVLFFPLGGALQQRQKVGQRTREGMAGRESRREGEGERGRERGREKKSTGEGNRLSSRRCGGVPTAFRLRFG